MSYYGSDPSPISTEPTSPTTSDALQSVESEGATEGTDESLGDGIAQLHLYGW